MDLVVCTACGIPNRIKLQENTRLRAVCDHCKTPLTIAPLRCSSQPPYIHFPVPNEHEIIEAEKRLGIKLHPDYREFLHSGYPVPNKRFQPLLIDSECEDLCSTAEEHWCVFNVPRNLLPFLYDTETDEHYYINQFGHVASLGWSSETEKHWPSIQTWQRYIIAPVHPVTQGLSKNELFELIKTFFDKKSPRAGRLLEINRGSYTHYGIAISDDLLLSWGPRTFSLWEHHSSLILEWITHEYTDSEDVSYLDLEVIFENILASPFAFHQQWDYCARGWNCEHWARLVVCGTPFSNQVGKKRWVGGRAVNPDAAKRLEDARKIICAKTSRRIQI